MAYIDKSNVTNGNTIQATDITNIVDALDSTSATAIKILGEFAQGTGVIPAAGTKAFAQGRGTIASGSFSHSEGFSTEANGDYSHAEGFDSISSGTYSHAEGNTTIALGEGSHAEGYLTKAIGPYSHAEGSGIEGDVPLYTTALGTGSHAEGISTKTGTQNAYYATSVSSGVVTLSSSYSDVSAQFVANNLLYLYDTPFDDIYFRDYFKISQSYYAAPNTIVELYDTSVTTTTAYVGDINYGYGAFNWTGDQTIPGDYSHTEGDSTIAYGISSHAEGFNTLASGDNSHAEGSGGTRAIGYSSHAEGLSSQATGDYSHAEGAGTQAIGEGSHAEGYDTITLGLGSHAEGHKTIASGSYQHVSGKYNTHGDNTSLFIVGNGVSQDGRKDAFKVTHSSSIQIPQTQSAAPTWTGRDGEIIPATVSGKYYLYMWMSGAWRSGSFA